MTPHAFSAGSRNTNHPFWINGQDVRNAEGNDPLSFTVPSLFLPFLPALRFVIPTAGRNLLFDGSRAEPT